MGIPMAQRVVFMRGLSASGKSTYARNLVTSEGFARVNMDDIRTMLALPFTKVNDALALEVQKQAVLAALRAGCDVVVDNLHLHMGWPRDLAYAIKEAGWGDAVQYELVDLTDISVDQCVEFNAGRDGPITEAIIRRQAKQLDGLRSAGLWTLDDLPV